MKLVPGKMLQSLNLITVCIVIAYLVLFVGALFGCCSVDVYLIVFLILFSHYEVSLHVLISASISYI